MLFLIISLIIVLVWGAAFLARTFERKGALMVHFLGVLALIGWTVGNSFTVVPAGHAGVVEVLGKVSDEELRPGIRVVNPLATVHDMSVRMREIMETAQVPSSEGLNVVLDVSLQYNLDPAMASDIYREIGMDFEKVFVVPQLRSHIRGATASFEAKGLYTSGREAIAARVLEELAPVYESRGFANATILLRQVMLPEMVAGAIEKKLKAEQEAEEMKFVLDREKQEAERKRVEAGGIADFQSIVTEGISDKLLRWKGIEATEKLAQSPNTKIIVVGGQDGLPLILNSAR